VAGRDAQPVNAAQLDRRPRHGHPIEAEIATNGQLTEIDLTLQHRPASED
jgi:hypothetical protein